MLSAQLAVAIWSSGTWVVGRLNAARCSPLPFTVVREQVGALLHTGIGAALVCVIAVVALVQGVRGAWLETFRYWYPS
jgi:hypothetical protein